MSEINRTARREFTLIGLSIITAGRAKADRLKISRINRHGGIGFDQNKLSVNK